MARLHKSAGKNEDPRIVEHPDGFYWLDPDSGEEIGPFATLAEAVADMESVGADFDAPTLDEAESEIGINDWIDPDTGLPAEEFAPHLEDH